MSRPPRAWIEADQLRQMFNEGGYWERIKSGDLVVGRIKDKIPNPPPRGHPPGTHSQYIRYVNHAGEFIVAVHQYVLPSGRLGGSGKPDPKELVANGYLYKVY